MTIKEISKRLTLLEELPSNENIVRLYGRVSSLEKGVEQLQISEKGRIRKEVDAMFKTVMTERDLLQWRIPFWATRIIKWKNQPK